MTVLVTGASGYIGRHLVDVLVAAGLSVRVLLRAGRSRSTRSSDSSTRVEIATGDLADPASLSGVCRGIDTVFHLAGYAHADDSDRASGHALHRQVTVAGTRALLEQAVAAGAKKFVFVSSVKAAGEGGDLQLNEDSPASPSSGYGKAKREAERLVLNAAIRHTAVLRLPLVYGRDNKGNLPRMIAAIDRGRFPPPPRVRNRRSMVHVDDVVRALLLVSEDPRAHGQCYIVTDDRDYSTRELYELICQALGRAAPRWTVPLSVFKAMASVGDLVGATIGLAVPFDSNVYGKMFGSAYYSSEKIRRELGFRPTRTLADGLAEMIEQYRRPRQR